LQFVLSIELYSFVDVAQFQRDAELGHAERAGGIQRLPPPVFASGGKDLERGEGEVGSYFLVSKDGFLPRPA
jgi:hypothetical protein